MNRYVYVPCVSFRDGGGIVEDCDGNRFAAVSVLEIVGKSLCAIGRVTQAFSAMLCVEFRDGRQAWFEMPSPIWYEPPTPTVVPAPVPDHLATPERVKEVLYGLGRLLHSAG